MRIPAILAVVLFASTLAVAETPEWALAKGEHVGGFFRLGLWGTPAAKLEYNAPAGGTTSVNEGSIIRVLAGWSVAPGVALHVTLLDLLLPEDEGMMAFAWGPGATVYGPANTFATATVGFSPASVDGTGHPSGWRWTLGVGKEFQIWPNAGMGAMLTWDCGSWEDFDSKEEWTLGGPGFQFTWTVN